MSIYQKLPALAFHSLKVSHLPPPIKLVAYDKKIRSLEILPGSRKHAFVRSHREDPGSDFHCFRCIIDYFSSRQQHRLLVLAEKLYLLLHCVPKIWSFNQTSSFFTDDHWNFTKDRKDRYKFLIFSLIIVRKDSFFPKKTNFALRKKEHKDTNMIQPPIEKIFHSMNDMARALFDWETTEQGFIFILRRLFFDFLERTLPVRFTFAH